jgi:hypothetical protein
MFRHVALTVFGKSRFKVRTHEIDFAPPWRRVRMTEAVREVTGIDFLSLKSVDEANAALLKLGIDDAQPTIGEALVRAFEEKVEPTLIQPTLVYGHPIEISPLAKPMADDPRFVERFEIFIGGMECGDNWSEQNDPVHLLKTWQGAYRADERDTGKFHTLDFDFIEAIEYGLPPTTGIGPGVERMAMIFTEQENIDDVIFFPMMRPAISPLNAAIYDVHEPGLGPVEDLVLSLDQFKSLCDERVITPCSHHLVLKPHARVWRPASSKGHAAVHVEIEGFLPNGTLRLAGYSLALQATAETSEQLLKQIADMIDSSLTAFLRKTFPAAKITGNEPTVLHN